MFAWLLLKEARSTIAALLALRTAAEAETKAQAEILSSLQTLAVIPPQIMVRVQVPTQCDTTQMQRQLIGRLAELRIELDGHESTPASRPRAWSWRRLQLSVHDVWGNFT